MSVITDTWVLPEYSDPRNPRALSRSQLQLLLLMLLLLIGFVAWFWNCVHAGSLVRSSWISKEHDVTHYGRHYSVIQLQVSLKPIQVSLRSNHHQRLIFACVIPVLKNGIGESGVDWVRNLYPWKLRYSKNTKTTKHWSFRQQTQKLHKVWSEK